MKNSIIVAKEQSEVANKLEEAIRNHKDFEDIQLPVHHHFSNGLYVRQLDIPKGMVIVGKRHREATLNILAKGSMIIICNGEKVQIDAPYTFTSEPLVKKSAYTLEDCAFINIFKTDSTDLDIIEEQFIISEEEFNELYIASGGVECLT